MTEIHLPDPITYTIDVRNVDTRFQVGFFALPYVPTIGDRLIIDGIQQRVTVREWELDEPNPETKPYVTLLVTPIDT